VSTFGEIPPKAENPMVLESFLNGEKMKKNLIVVAGIALIAVIFSGCASLSYRLTAGDDENSRLSALEDIKFLDNNGKIQTASALKEYFIYPNSSVRRRAAEALLKLGPDVAIPVFISMFSDKNQEIRVMAEEYVVKFGDKALPLLLKALSSPDKFERAHAAYALGEIEPSRLEVTKRLFISMGEDDKYVSGAARDSIIKIGIIDMEDLLSALKNESGKTCFGAAFIAGKKKIADKRILEALLDNLKFPNIIVRNSTENALVEIGAVSREAVDLMLEKYKTGDDFMKECLIVIFGNIGGPASETIAELSIALRGNNNKLAIAAAESLCKINSSSEGILKEIIAMALSSDLERKIAALKCLGKMRVNYKDISACLLKAFGDKIVLVRDVAVKSYIKVAYLSKDSGDSIKVFFASSDRYYRESAAKVAGFLLSSAQKDYVSELISLLKDKEKTVRIAAVESLGDLGARSAKAMPELVKLLADNELGVQFAAKNTIEKIGMLSKLASKLLILNIDDENLHISIAVQNSIIKIGQKAIQPLLEALKEDNNKIKAKIAYILGKIGGEKGSPMMKEVSLALINVIKNEDAKVRASAAEALGNIGIEYKDSIMALSESLRDKDDNVRLAAVDSLGKIGSGAKSAAPFLAQTLKDKSNKVAIHSRDSIIKLGNDAVPYLAEALKDEDSVVRSYASDALQKIGTSDAYDALRKYKASEK
jgi:HEAT repeat protein